MTKNARIYPVFLPHAGCPFQCIYCNQYAVSGAPRRTNDSEALIATFRRQFEALLESARRSDRPGELAFYGGVFTALGFVVLREILDTVLPEIRRGLFSGIRFSTRPDCVSEEICSFLADYPIQTVELGVQSFSDDVLTRSRRGYKAEAVDHAAARVKRHGWDLGLQLMVGLPGDDPERFLASVSKAVSLQPAFVRIYPTLVLAGTPLADWFRRGLYRPLELKEAVEWCEPAYDALKRAGVPAARMGLHADRELEKPGNILAGPHHPAFGHLVRAAWWRMRVDRRLESLPELARETELTILAGKGALSEIIGHRGENLIHWRERWRLEKVTVREKEDWDSASFECRPGSAADDPLLCAGGGRRRDRARPAGLSAASGR